MATYEVTAVLPGGVSAKETVEADSLEDRDGWVTFTRAGEMVLKLKIADVSRIERKGD